MTRVGISLLLFVSACSQQPTANEVDIGIAARAAQASVDRYAQSGVASRRVTLAALPNPPSARTAENKPSRREVVNEARYISDSALGAAKLVQRYYALIQDRDYRAAWQLWDRDGAASGMSLRDFSDSFTKYAEYHAKVGAPGSIDAGAGQRYVTVTVEAYGTLRDGTAFAMDGPVTLHRVADVDGATASQRSWRIYDSGLKPHPSAEPTTAVRPPQP